MASNSNERITDHYAGYDETQRLTDGFGALERTRTQQLIQRFLPLETATVCDVGGAHGVYSFWLASLGHQVHLLDIVAKHIVMAQMQQHTSAHKLASLLVGDARQLPYPDEMADVMINHGPLYHLLERHERQATLQAALRVLRPGGVLLGFAINRYAGLMYGLAHGLVFQPDYFAMLQQEVTAGVRQDSPAWANTFSHAYFHTPTELAEEVIAAGFELETVLGVIGPAWQVPDLNTSWADQAQRETLLKVAQLTELEPILGPRLLAVARKPI